MTKEEVAKVSMNAIKLHYEKNVSIEKIINVLTSKYGIEKDYGNRIINWRAELNRADLYYDI